MNNKLPEVTKSNEKNEKNEQNDKNEKNEQNEKNEKNEQNEKNEKNESNEKNKVKKRKKKAKKCPGNNIIKQEKSVANNNNVNTGQQKPISNWEKYKNIIAKEASTTKQGSYAKVRKKRNLIPFKEPDKCKVQYSEKNQIAKTNCTKVTKEENDQNQGLTRRIAIDCEMVGIGNGKQSMIARVSIVNVYGVCVYDKYVKPIEIVKNYRTHISGIRPHHLKNGEDFNVVQREVANILKGRILIGHALYNDLSVLFLSHPKRSQRDTAKYFRKLLGGNTPSLKHLAAEFLDTDIQTGEHNSIEDARTTMQLYKLFRPQWESRLGVK